MSLRILWSGGIAIADTSEVYIRLSRADFSSPGLGDKKFSIEADLGQVVQVYHPECDSPGETLGEQLDANSIVYLGSHAGSADYGCAVFASNGERSAEVEIDQEGTYLVPADAAGVIDQSDLDWLREFIPFRKEVVAKLGLCICCELPPEKCRAITSAEAVI